MLTLTMTSYLMARRPPSSSSDPGSLAAVLDLVGVPEIAEMLNASRRTAWRYVERDDFPEPAAKVSGKRLWKRRDIERWAKRTLPLPKDPRRRKSDPDVR
jgi:predicted DNA-binding transcriptional regulator AlpA